MLTPKRIGLFIGIVVLSVIFWNWLKAVPSLDAIRAMSEGGDLDSASDAIARYLETDPENARALILGAQLAARSDDLIKCVELLSRVPFDSASKPEAALREGQTLKQLGYGAHAELALLNVIASSEARGEMFRDKRQIAQGELVSLYTLELRWFDARRTLWEMYGDHQNPWRLLIALSQLDKRPPNAKLAIEAFQKMLELDPADHDARAALALYHNETGDWDTAERDATRVLEEVPDNRNALDALLQSFARRASWDKLEAFLGADPNGQSSATRLATIALYHETKGDVPNARLQYEAALRLNPFDAEINFRFGRLLIALKDAKRASLHLKLSEVLKKRRQELDETLFSVTVHDPEQRPPPSPNQSIALAQQCLDLGLARVARGWLDHSLTLDPNNEQARRLVETLPENDEACRIAKLRLLGLLDQG